MKVEVKDLKVEVVTYPCLMQNDLGNIILVNEDGSGVVLKEGSHGSKPIGYYSTNWAIFFLKPYLGSITLSNN